MGNTVFPMKWMVAQLSMVCKGSFFEQFHSLKKIYKKNPDSTYEIRNSLPKQPYTITNKHKVTCLASDHLHLRQA